MPPFAERKLGRRLRCSIKIILIGGNVIEHLSKYSIVLDERDKVLDRGTKAFSERDYIWKQDENLGIPHKCRLQFCTLALCIMAVVLNDELSVHYLLPTFRCIDSAARLKKWMMHENKIIRVLKEVRPASYLLEDAEVSVSITFGEADDVEDHASPLNEKVE